jgi:hypothetical protein
MAVLTVERDRVSNIDRKLKPASQSDDHFTAMSIRPEKLELSSPHVTAKIKPRRLRSPGTFPLASHRKRAQFAIDTASSCAPPTQGCRAVAKAQTWKDGVIGSLPESITAFELIGRIMPAGREVRCASLNCSFVHAVEKLRNFAEEQKGVFRAGRDSLSFTVQSMLSRNDLVMVRFAVLPLEEDLVILSASRVLGTDEGFRNVCSRVLQHFSLQNSPAASALCSA